MWFDSWDLSSLQSGTSVPQINRQDLAPLLLPLPPRSEQKRIVEILTDRLATIEKARAATADQLAAAKALPAAYLREVFDSPEAQKWKRKKLGNVLELRREVIHPRNQPQGPAEFVGLEHIQSLTGIRIGSLPVEMSKLAGRKPQFYKGDIVYGYLRPYLNKVWLAEFDGLCSVDQYVFSTIHTVADPDFVAWFMRSPVYLTRAPIGDIQSQLPRIRTDEVMSVEINLPSLEKQQKIVKAIEEKFSETERLRQSLQSQLDTINQLPAALLRQAFNGEL
jgi:restriction endonuclease S subunit